MIIENNDDLIILSQLSENDDYVKISNCVNLQIIDSDKIKVLYIINCHQFSKLSNLPNLTYLRIEYCPLFSDIPFELTNIKGLRIIECPLFSVIPSSLTNITTLYIKNCSIFSVISFELTNITTLQIEDCPLFSVIPSSLTNLYYLSISKCPVTTINNLTFRLICKECPLLTSIQGNFPNLMSIECLDCPLLTSIQGNFPELVELYCPDCPSLTSIPEQLVKIKTIVCEGSNNLRISKQSYPSLRTCTCCTKPLVNTIFTECPEEIDKITGKIITKTCGICRNNFKNDFEKNKCFIPALVSGKPHSHGFHKKCLLGWIQKNNTCPICRKKIQINNNPPEYIDDPDSDVEFGKRRSKRRSKRKI